MSGSATGVSPVSSAGLPHAALNSPQECFEYPIRNVSSSVKNHIAELVRLGKQGSHDAMESLLNMAVRDDALGTVVRDNLVALHTDSRTSPSVRRNLGQACADISNTIFKAIEHRRTMQRIVELDHIPLPILYLGELYTQSPIKNQDEDCLAQDIRELEADDFARLHDTHPDLVLAREECAQLCKLALHSSIAQMQLHDSQPSTGAALYKYMTERVVLLAQAHAQQHGDAVLNEQLDHYLKLMTAQA